MTKEIKHTPGPWEWHLLSQDCDYKFYGIFSRKEGNAVLLPNCTGDNRVAWFEYYPSYADRNLIAAAPDLLEALKCARAVFYSIFTEGDEARIISEQLSLIDTAIAKVEGK